MNNSIECQLSLKIKKFKKEKSRKTAKYSFMHLFIHSTNICRAKNCFRHRHRDTSVNKMSIYIYQNFLTGVEETKAKEKKIKNK